MDKTVVVEVTRLVKHPKVGKYIKRGKRYKAHDEANAFHAGDKVLIELSKPRSKDKKWEVVSEKPAVAEPKETETQES